MTMLHNPSCGRDERLAELRLLWQERRDQGQIVLPEALCGDCPELVEPLQRQLQALVAMEAAIGLGQQTPTSPRPAAPVVPAPEIPGYEIAAILAQGGMGIVYKARQVAMNRVVALKMMLAGAFAQPEQRARFRTEIEAA